MFAALVQGRLPGVEVQSVPMRFSSSIEELGIIRAGKVLHLVQIIVRIFAARLRQRFDIFYFPASGPSRAAFLRDAAVLLATRWMFPRFVLHLHSADLAATRERLPWFLKPLFAWAYGHPDATVRLSESSPRDDLEVRSQRCFVVPNGIADEGAPPVRAEAPAAPLRLVYVGALAETKGVLVLLEATRLLLRAGVPVEVTLVGDFRPTSLRARVAALLDSPELAAAVRITGVLTGDAKQRELLRADAFCFPSFYEGENQSVAVMEAMMCGLPVIAARWRAIGDLVEHGRTGLLVPPRDPAALADAIRQLAADRPLARRMGSEGRRSFESNLTIHRHLARMAEVFRAVRGAEQPARTNAAGPRDPGSALPLPAGPDWR